MSVSKRSTHERRRAVEQVLAHGNRLAQLMCDPRRTVELLLEEADVESTVRVPARHVEF
jgi:hypothetical protein